MSMSDGDRTRGWERSPKGLPALEERNIEEIEGLNQRGGRMLSMVDLLEDETLSVEVAGYLLFAMGHGASVLTGARPGGAGKTALLAAILNLLPPGEPIVTVARGGVLRSAPPRPVCLLAHEIGSGPYYGYIWGKDVPMFLEKAKEGYRIAATLHADDPVDVRNELGILGVSEEMLSHVTVMAFIQAERSGWRIRRRVHSIYENTSYGGHRLLFRDEGTSFAKEHPSALAEEAGSEEDLYRCSRFFEHLSCPPELSSVRSRVLAFYGEAVE